jgi:menaquinone-9 beta-reductase
MDVLLLAEPKKRRRSLARSHAAKKQTQKTKPSSAARTTINLPPIHIRTAIFRHPNDELNICYYLIPCGPNKSKGQCGAVDEDDLARLHTEAIPRDPFISAALGPAAKIERMRAASLRLGNQGIRTSYDDHLVIVGDAAGHIDPLTGEGIHTAMMGGKAAAGAIAKMAASGDFTKRSAKALYEKKWMQLFGHDFFWSRVFADAIYRCPLLLDAMASEMQRKGDAMMSRWAEVMTCLRPKTYLLRPDVGLPLAVAIAREVVEQKVFGKPDRYELGPAPAAK